MSYTPQTPTINFGPPGAAGPGSGFFGRSDPNAMMLQMGLSYGQNILQQQLQQGEAGLAHYMPIIRAFRNYFAVDNTYVKRKLVILTMPFFTKFVRKPSAGGEGGEFGGGGSGGGGGGGAADGMGDQAFGVPAGTPASVYPGGSPGARMAGHMDGSNTNSMMANAAGTSLPLHDVFASDLYIPLMSVITYVVLAAFIDGANSQKSVITADSLISTAWVIGIWFFLELAVMKGIAYALRVVPTPPLLELLALCGYKYVLLCIGVLIAQSLPPGRLYSGLVMLYGVLAHSFFTVRLTALQHTRDDGRVAPRCRVFTYVAALAQVPAFLWLFVRPLYSSG